MKLDITSVFIGVCILGGGYTYWANENQSQIQAEKQEQKDNESAKYLATYYQDIPAEQIKIIKTYEDKGRKVYMFKIGNNICEMPTIKEEEKLTALGLSCIK